MKNTTAMADYELRHIEALRKNLAGCTVLLKKDGSFPLEKPCTLAAYGSGVRRTIRGGTGSGEVNSRYIVTIEEGLQQAGFTLTGMEWHTGYEQAREKAHKAFLKQLKKDAKAAKQNFILYGMGKVMPEPEYDLPLNAEGDAAIYVVSRISGEGNDRTPLKGDIRLTDSEVRDILALDKKFTRFMLVLNVGGVVDLSPVMSVRNILLLSQLGVETGGALADILLGKANPSGKLTTTWAAFEEYPEMPDFEDMNETRTQLRRSYLIYTGGFFAFRRMTKRSRVSTKTSRPADMWRRSESTSSGESVGISGITSALMVSAAMMRTPARVGPVIVSSCCNKARQRWPLSSTRASTAGSRSTKYWRAPRSRSTVRSAIS